MLFFGQVGAVGIQRSKLLHETLASTSTAAQDLIMFTDPCHLQSLRRMLSPNVALGILSGVTTRGGRTPS